MHNLEELIADYLTHGETQKILDAKTTKDYRIDLNQFADFYFSHSLETLSSGCIEQYIAQLHQKYSPRSAKRKIASLRAFCRYLEFRDLIEINPFNKIQIKFREPTLLPKTIALHTIETFISTLYQEQRLAQTDYQKACICRHIAVIELLFATGMRISELCNLQLTNIDFSDRSIRIFGKGSKERMIQIGNEDVMHAIESYFTLFQDKIESCGYFFVNRLGKRLSEQSVRNMINKYCAIANISQHITPHMFRHSFATFLLEEDVDIRYIQEMLGHSSINVTQIYTHVAMAKQKTILTTKNPRRKIVIQK